MLMYWLTDELVPRHRLRHRYFSYTHGRFNDTFVDFGRLNH